MLIPINLTVIAEGADFVTVSDDTIRLPEGGVLLDADGKTTVELEAKGEMEVVIPVPDAEAVTKVVVTDKEGNETEVDFEVKDGCVAISVSGNSTVKIQTGHICYANDFTDIDLDAWYHLDIDYVLENGFMKGTATDKFAPNDNITREQIAAMLHRFIEADRF